MSPEEMQRMVDMLPTATTLSEIARTLGITKEELRSNAVPFLTLMRVAGTLPDCGCGKPRYHHGMCRVVAPMSPELMHRRELIIGMLVDGMRLVDIEAIFGRSKDWAKVFLRYLTPEQMAERDRRVEERIPDCYLSGPHARAMEMLAAGARHVDVIAATGLSRAAVERCVARLSPQQRTSRKQAIQQRPPHVLGAREPGTGRLLPTRLAA